MILYHGSLKIVNPPVYHGGSSHNDYGYGFYCTEDPEKAKEWACQSNSNGYANRYSFWEDGLHIVDLNGPGYSILNWLAVLAKHRSYWERSAISEQAKRYLQDNFYPDLSDADVIRGYRADDSYFSFARAFVSNGITVEQLSQAMRLGELGEQVVLVSRRAYEQIMWESAELVDCATYFPLAKDREREANRAYRRIVREEPVTSGLFMVDIIRRGMKNEDFL